MMIVLQHTGSLPGYPAQPSDVVAVVIGVESPATMQVCQAVGDAGHAHANGTGQSHGIEW